MALHYLFCSRVVRSSAKVVELCFTDFPPCCRNIKFDGAIVGKAQLSAMCTTRSGGVVQVRNLE